MPCPGVWWGCPSKETISDCGKRLPCTWWGTPEVPSSVDNPGWCLLPRKCCSNNMKAHGQMMPGGNGAEKEPPCCSLPDEERVMATEGLPCSWKSVSQNHHQPLNSFSFKRNCLWMCVSVGSLGSIGGVSMHRAFGTSNIKILAREKYYIAQLASW